MVIPLSEKDVALIVMFGIVLVGLPFKYLTRKWFKEDFNNLFVAYAGCFIFTYLYIFGGWH